MSLHRKYSHNGNALELRCLLIFTGILFETQETSLEDDRESPFPHEKCRPNSDKSTTNHRRELGPTGISRLVRSNRKQCADIGTRPIRDTDSYPHIVLGYSVYKAFYLLPPTQTIFRAPRKNAMYSVVLHLFLPCPVFGRKEGRKPALFAAICASSSLAAVLCTLEMNGDVFVIRKLSKSIILSWTWVVCIPGKLLIINCTRRRYTGASRIVCVGGCVFGGEEQGRETRNAINLAVKPRRRNNTLWEIHYYYS